MHNVIVLVPSANNAIPGDFWAVSFPSGGLICNIASSDRGLIAKKFIDIMLCHKGFTFEFKFKILLCKIFKICS